MANIKVIDFSTDVPPEEDVDVIEHLKVDNSADYLYVDKSGHIRIHCAQHHGEDIAIINIDYVDNLIKALQYIKQHN